MLLGALLDDLQDFVSDDPLVATAAAALILLLILLLYLRRRRGAEAPKPRKEKGE